MIDLIVVDRTIAGGLRIVDLVIAIICFVAAAVVTAGDVNWFGASGIWSVRLQAPDVLTLALMMVLWLGIFQIFGLYSDSRMTSLPKSILALAQAVTTGSIAILAIGTVLDTEIVGLKFAGVFWVEVMALGGLARYAATLAYRQINIRSNTGLTYLIVGANERSLRLVQSIENESGSARKFLGFVDEKRVGRDGEKDGTERPLLTDLNNLPDYLRQNPVDEVLVCLPLKSYYDQTMEIIACCEEQGVTVRVLADLFQTRMTHSRVEQVGNQSVITVACHDIRGIPAIAKRAVDVVLSGILLVALSPLMALASFLIVATSPGPAIFAQERVGHNKKIFRVLKFRTMVADAEVRQVALESMNEAEGPAFKMANDPRVTSIGKFLRKSSIDELPQLINVLKGEMSLVGPRPLPLRDYSGFEEDWHRRRLSVKPGITGLWQVIDRDHDSFERWMKLDMLYIDQWSFWLDLKIILKTIPAVLKGSGE